MNRKLWIVGVLYFQKGYSAAVTLLATVLLSRAFGPDGLGEYSLFQTGLQFALVFGLMGANMLVIERSPYVDVEHRSDFASTILAGCALTLIPAGLVLASVLAGLGSTLTAGSWILLPAGLFAVLTGFFVSKDQQLISSLLDAVARTTVFLILVFLGTEILDWTLPTIVNVGLGLAYAGTLSLGMVVGGLRIGSPRGGLGLLLSPNTVAASATFTLMGVHTIVMSQGDRFVATSLVDRASVGIYAAAQNVLNIVLYAATSLTSILLPIVAKGVAGAISRQHFESRMKSSARLLFCFSCVSVLVTYLFTDAIIAVFGDGFSEMRLPLLILMGGLCASFAFGFPQTALSMSGKGRTAFLWAMSLWMPISLLLSLVLTGLLGIVGTASANALSAIGSRLTFFALVLTFEGIDVSVFPSRRAVTPEGQG